MFGYPSQDFLQPTQEGAVVVLSSSLRQLWWNADHFPGLLALFDNVLRVFLHELEGFVPLGLGYLKRHGTIIQLFQPIGQPTLETNDQVFHPYNNGDLFSCSFSCSFLCSFLCSFSCSFSCSPRPPPQNNDPDPHPRTPLCQSDIQNSKSTFKLCPSQ